jgi:hypothetical protein
VNNDGFPWRHFLWGSAVGAILYFWLLEPVRVAIAQVVVKLADILLQP